MKKIGMGIVVLLACVLVACAVRKPRNKEVKTTTEAGIEKEDETMTDAPLPITTEEKYTEAPKDTSNWEIQTPADTSPDTGAPIE